MNNATHGGDPGMQPTCINLLERFGDRYQIGWDPAYNPKGVRRDRLDPWYMTIPCKYGEIYPKGGDILIIELRSHPRIRARLGEMGLEPHQLGDTEGSWRFHVDDFDRIAEVVNPLKRRRPNLTNQQREKRRQRMKALNERLRSQIS